MDINLSENQVVRDVSDTGDERFWRILWVPPGQSDVVLIEMGTDKGVPRWMAYSDLVASIDANHMALCVEDPASGVLRPDSRLSVAESQTRDRRFALIESLVRDSERCILYESWRSKLIRERAAETGTSVRLLYKYLRLWWQLGQLPNALAPLNHRRGAPGKERNAGAVKLGRPRFGAGAVVAPGINVVGAIAQKLRAGAHFLKMGMSWRKAYQEILLREFSYQIIEDGIRMNRIVPVEELPSFDQFRYHVGKTFRRGDIQRALGGEAKFARNNRPRTGTARNMASGPGGIYQIDATVANIYLRSHLDSTRLIGRPVLYLVIDHYSRMIVGFTVALSGPSWETGKLALENAFTDKVAFCKSYNIEITEREWPGQHLCRQLTGDRGWDQLGRNAGEAARALNYRAVNLPPYRPDLKGLVESRFELIDNADIKWAAGAVQGRDRGAPKHTLDGVYTIGTFTEFMVRCIIRYNNAFAVNKPPSDFVMADGRAPTPVELWEFGCRTCGAPQIADRDRVRKSLLHAGRARETDVGLRFHGLHYQPSDPKKFDWFVRVKGRTWREHDIRYDPRDATAVFLVVNDGTSFERCRLTEADREFRGWTFVEVADHFARKRVADREHEDDRLLAGSRHQAAMADLEARSRDQFAGVSLITRRASGDSLLRAAEVRELRRVGAWSSDAPGLGGPNDPDPPTPDPMPEQPHIEPLSFKPSYTSMLRKIRDAALQPKKEDEE